MPDQEFNQPDAADAAGLEETESLALYSRLKSKATGTPRVKLSRDARARLKNAQDHPNEQPFMPGRDPKGLDDILENLTQQLGWKAPLAKSDLLEDWPDIVGPDIAARTKPLGIDESVLTILCESTAWATQLRLMRTEVLTKVLHAHPESGVTAIRFQGPNAPSWKRGPKSIPGRGPRDTYG
ncbi:putative nucleic acid-binding Zn ribbon protein [Aurantimicrobium minutum]|uniref:DUF721 domain-containing protein n=1 Tax=Aurantimicrobium minutum TaxID=708131 RepID=UPI002476241B|nr:DciA family protein [Aurantimicrobium minutum]MDH6532121.1 putative nucleic acid-binding Zn ribbon protein [Aurantimicrobium minutum]